MRWVCSNCCSAFCACLYYLYQAKLRRLMLAVTTVFELPGGLGGLNPPVVCSTPQTRCPGIPRGGGQFQPPAVVNDAELPVCNDNDNE
jgi:hypothetical protein